MALARRLGSHDDSCAHGALPPGHAAGAAEPLGRLWRGVGRDDLLQDSPGFSDVRFGLSWQTSEALLDTVGLGTARTGPEVYMFLELVRFFVLIQKNFPILGRQFETVTADLGRSRRRSWTREGRGRPTTVPRGPCGCELTRVLVTHAHAQAYHCQTF